MYQIPLGDEVEKAAKESTNTVPIACQPCTVRVYKTTKYYCLDQISVNIRADCATQHSPGPPCRERRPDNLATR